MLGPLELTNLFEPSNKVVILQASLVKKLGGIIAIVSILNEIESLKFFTIEVQRNISN